ncbi:MAG: ATP synthase F1 subunit epsilon [Endomicrobium sp.]|jgi:F-type H+-transporting ATPase subunit epsilon|nr:ATP synthase F1 subunit epsilon [Endomicrobium sp.]
MNKFEIEILSPEGIIFKGKTASVSFPTTRGIITVLSGHTNLVTKLNSGEIIIETIVGIKKITVSGGFIEIVNNNVNVVAEFAAHFDEISRQKIKQAIDHAKDMKSKRKEFVNIYVIESQLKKSAVDLKSGLGIKRKKV